MDKCLIYSVFEAAENKIVGRIRVQKIFYLLEKLGMNGGARFSYHHYGPYSESLASELDVVRLLDGRLTERTETTQYGATYSIFELSSSENAEALKTVGSIPIDDAKRFLKSMKSTTSVVLELAATIYWLKYDEKIENWKSELQKRKSAKATEGNINAALQLLSELGLGTFH